MSDDRLKIKELEAELTRVEDIVVSLEDTVKDLVNMYNDLKHRVKVLESKPHSGAI